MGNPSVYGYGKGQLVPTYGYGKKKVVGGGSGDNGLIIIPDKIIKKSFEIKISADVRIKKAFELDIIGSISKQLEASYEIKAGIKFNKLAEYNING